MRYPPAPPPEGPSELIDLAVADARQLDRTRYTPNPYVWHRPADDGACMICVAGSVIAGTLKCPTDKDVEVGEGHGANPDRVTINDKRWQRALWALDDARQGNWDTAYDALDTPPTLDLFEELIEIPRPDHSQFKDWTEFDAHLESLATCAIRAAQARPASPPRPGARRRRRR